MVESKVGLSALKTENDRIGVQKLIDQEVNRLLDIPNEKRKAVSVFLLWMTNPSLLESTTEKSKSSLLTAAQEIVYSDSKLELAVDYIGSRLALQSQGFADMFETTIPLPAFLPNRTLNRIEQLYNEKSNAQQISSETGLSISNVYSAIEKLKRAGKVKPRTEQFNYARVDELDFEVAVKWNAGLPQNRIMTLLNLTNGRFTGIAHKLIELGIVNRRTQHQTISQKRSLDSKVMHLRREGKSRREIAELLNTTDGIIQSSIRRLVGGKRLKNKERRFTKDEWNLLDKEVKQLRAEGISWKEIKNRLKISEYRCHKIRQGLKTKS
ncbi:MAG: hypothetical protein AAB609_04265 [Patescibacteria group bacterium]